LQLGLLPQANRSRSHIEHGIAAWKRHSEGGALIGGEAAEYGPIDAFLKRKVGEILALLGCQRAGAVTVVHIAEFVAGLQPSCTALDLRIAHLVNRVATQRMKYIATSAPQRFMWFCIVFDMDLARFECS
jgi:hypothetical protein